MLCLFAEWFEQNYDKIWLIVCIISIIFVTIGLLSGNDVIFDIGDTTTDFYDEILSE